MIFFSISCPEDILLRGFKCHSRKYVFFLKYVKLKKKKYFLEWGSNPRIQNLFQGRNTKIFCSFFGSNENCRICFRDYLTFTLEPLHILFISTLVLSKVCNKDGKAYYLGTIHILRQHDFELFLTHPPTVGPLCQY